MPTSDWDGGGWSSPVPATRAASETKLIWVELDEIALSVQPVDLSVGDPDFTIPAKLKEDLQQVVDGENHALHQYTRGFGHPRLCAALSSMYKFQRGYLPPDAEVVITNGATEALFVAILGLVNPGDEVIIIEPFFDAFAMDVNLAEATAVFVPLRPSSETSSSSADWRLDTDELKQAFNANTAAIIINTPHNPMGKLFSIAELEEIGSLCRQYNVAVISDEVYESWVYDDQKHVSIATLPGMWERTITIGSAGKTFTATGLRIGWMMGPIDLLAGPKIIHQNCGYICNTPIQEALSRSFEREAKLLQERSPLSYFTSSTCEAQAKRDLIVSSLKQAGCHPIVPQGGYYILADVSDIMDKVEFDGDDSETETNKTIKETKETKDIRFVKWLSKTKKLQGFPPSAFYSSAHKNIGENFIRLCFIKNDSTLLKAKFILDQLSQELKTKQVQLVEEEQQNTK